MATNYPYIYHKDPTTQVDGTTVKKLTSRGFGGMHGVSSLPKVLKQKLQRQKDKMSAKKTIVTKRKQEEGEEPPSRKRKSFVYGVDQTKFHTEGGSDQEELFAELQDMVGSDTETREKVYSQFRETIQKIVRVGDISNAVPDFLTNPLHLRNQYEWLCIRSITHKIEGELTKQLGHLEKVHQVWRPFQDYEQKLEAARVKSAQQMGSSLPIIVCWLRELNFHWHKVQGGLFLHPGEEEDTSPHFLVVKNAAGTRLPFDVRAERKTFFSGLNLAEAIATFFQLCFVANTKYPVKGDAVALWMQQRVAGIVDKGRLINIVLYRLHMGSIALK